MIADSGLALILQLEANPIMSAPSSHAHAHSHIKTETKGNHLLLFSSPSCLSSHTHSYIPLESSSPSSSLHQQQRRQQQEQLAQVSRILEAHYGPFEYHHRGGGGGHDGAADGTEDGYFTLTLDTASAVIGIQI